MVWTTTTTTVSDVDHSVVTLWDQGVLLSYTPELVADQVATIRRSINGSKIEFPLFSNLSIPASALTEDADATSVVLVDTNPDITPVEEGNVVTYGKLVDFQTGGRAPIAAAQLVGRNMGATLDNRAIVVLEAFSTTRIYPNAATAASNLATSDVLDLKFANRLYNKLARLNVPGIGGTYIGIAHDDCLFDLREALTPVRQYQDLVGVMRNEVGMAAGIRWLRSSNVTVTSNSNGTIDSYKVNVVGQNALGKAVAEEPHPTITGPFDKLGRFVNIGWYGVLKYGIIDTAMMVQGICASSVGDN
jgi:N4-gp56 family major capsid protein